MDVALSHRQFDTGQRFSHLLRPFLEEYEAVVFTMDQFVLPQLASKCIAPPSIR